MIVLYFIGGFAVIALVAFAAFVVGTKRAAQSFGEPTPAEAQIKVDTTNALKVNADKAAAAANEVANASKADLIRIGREQLSDDDVTPAHGTPRPHSQR